MSPLRFSPGQHLIYKCFLIADGQMDNFNKLVGWNLSLGTEYACSFSNDVKYSSW